MTTEALTPQAPSRPRDPSDLPRRVGPAETVGQSLTMAWRAALKMRRNFEQFFDVTAQPLIYVLMFAGLFGGAIAGSVEAYLPQLIPGLIALTVLTACIATGTQLRQDMDTGVFDRFKVLPISRIAPLAGPMIADTLRYVIAASLTFGTGIAIGYRPDGGVLGVLAAILLAVIAGWSLAWIFTFFGCIGRTAQSVQINSLMVMFVLTFVSNAVVEPSTMPRWLEAFADANPVSQLVAALRDLANEGEVTANVGWALLGCAAVVAIFAPLSVRVFSRKM